MNPWCFDLLEVTCAEQKSITEVAEHLGLSIGAVHIARSRVRARLREQVNHWEPEGGGSFQLAKEKQSKAGSLRDGGTKHDN